MQFKTLGLALCALLLSACSDSSSTKNFTGTLRFATFHVDMAYDNSQGYNQLLGELSAPAAQQPERLRNLAAVIQQRYQERQPDVLLLTGFSTDMLGEVADDTAIRLFQENYLAVAQGPDLDPISYSHYLVATTNSGFRMSGHDVNGDGREGQLPEDAQGRGHFHGQDAFVLLSKYPLDAGNARTFRDFKWQDVNQAVKPNHADGSAMDQNTWEAMSVMSTNFVDVAMRLPDGRQISLLATQLESQWPRDGSDYSDFHHKRNGAQLRFITDYISSKSSDADYLVDDEGRRGGVNLSRPFVLMGNLNNDEDHYAKTVTVGERQSHRLNNGAMAQMLTYSELLRYNGNVNYDPNTPGSTAGDLYAGQTDSNHYHPLVWTGLYGARMDYVLAHNDLSIAGSGIFWPLDGEDGFQWFYDAEGQPDPALSSHQRLVWVDIDFGRSK
ncbi:endonuclease/exonuclease/phosphatase family protein [Ferrimonas balearica]|uniref:endonuclease/exonuclease/phosphatase family protein n=1 Tax=Ferrimonas balearica TaxID=44012 RepID=UPI001C99A2E2|nr:endonuclease/exonuclease/phosphatase family protein [Ferrimonas balearica]MBY5993997.1 endonuclease/exonuclease/phosphatase family protein [Ferrimonas balearica]